MALTKVAPALFGTGNNITSVTVGGSANTISLTFDGSGVITSATNNAISVANTAITGNIISSQITSVANTQITGNITAAQITSVANTQISGNIASSQITSNPTLYGNVSVTGVIGVGGATPSTSGVGITFPATFSNSTNANTLDDYEEGTFTGTMSGGTTSPTCTVYYTKIGNQVTVQILSTTNITSSEIYYRVTGVPAELVPSSSAGVGMIGLVYLSNVGPNYFFGIFTCTTTRFDIQYNAANDNFPTSGTRGMSYLNGTYTTA